MHTGLLPPHSRTVYRLFTDIFVPVLIFIFLYLKPLLLLLMSQLPHLLAAPETGVRLGYLSEGVVLIQWSSDEGEHGSERLNASAQDFQEYATVVLIVVAAVALHWLELEGL